VNVGDSAPQTIGVRVSQHSFNKFAFKSVSTFLYAGYETGWVIAEPQPNLAARRNSERPDASRILTRHSVSHQIP